MPSTRLFPRVMSFAASSVRLTSRLPPTSLNESPFESSSSTSSRALSMIAVRRDAEGAEARFQVDRLLVERADHADALVAAQPRAVLVEFRFELALADVVDLAREIVPEHGDAAELRPQMRVIIGPVEENIGAFIPGNDSEKPAHDVPPIVPEYDTGLPVTRSMGT